MKQEQRVEGGLTCGLGRCGRCPCVAFKGSGNMCEECGHHYGDHGTSPFRAPERDDDHDHCAASAGTCCADPIEPPRLLMT